MKNLKYIILPLSVVLFLAAIYTDRLQQKRKTNFEKIASDASVQLIQLEKECRDHIDKFVEELGSQKALDQGALYSHYNSITLSGLSFFVTAKDSLVWWSDNTVLPSKDQMVSGFRFYQNGWYEFFVREKGPYWVTAMLKIKNQYAFQNRFLSNSFHECLDIPAAAVVTTVPSVGTYGVTNSGGSPLFYLDFDQVSTTVTSNGITATLYIVSYLIFLFGIYLISDSKGGYPFRAGLITLATILVTRILSVYFNYPESLYAQPLFSPSYYASSFLLNSLGDLLLTSVLLVYVVSIFYRIVAKHKWPSSKKDASTGNLVVNGAAFFTGIWYSVFVTYLIAGLIINSRISFNINNVFELNVYSLVGVLIIGILLVSFYMVSDMIGRMLNRLEWDRNFWMVSIIIPAGLFALLLLLFGKSFLFTDYSFPPFLLTIFLIFYLAFIRRNLRNINAFTRYLMIIFGFSIYAALSIAEFNQVREEESRKLLAVKLENEQDQIAEYLFDDIAAKVADDKVITGFFANTYEKQLSSASYTGIVERRLTQVYFTGYWGKYDIEIRCFNSEGLPVNTGGDPTWNLDYFNVIIRQEGRQTYSPYLFFSGNTSGKISYLGRIPVYDPVRKDIQTGTIVISLESKGVQDETGFPELLLSDKIPQKKDISNYSYAHYRNGMLVNQFGNFNYLVGSKSYEDRYDSLRHEQFVNFNNYSHLFYKTADNGLLIISIRKPGILEFITLFSYLFSFYGFCFVLCMSVFLLWKNKGRISFNFKNRIQAGVVIIVVSTMLLVGGATVYYIFRNYMSNLGLSVNDRLKSMLIAIHDELRSRTLDQENVSDEMNYTFSNLSNTLGIDFNIYSRNGFLIYSTQPKIYDQRLIARTMNREAFFNMAARKKSLHVQFEEIGTLRFLSAYKPVRNNNYQTTGYINLPYFARQNELKKDISSFLVALINIYVFLFAFTVFITFIISNRITMPLRLIQQRLGKINLGQTNEPIEWDHDDEIGELVKEYNRMVEELSESAELLARSERESAWREMARQVAHEIKNPLTPMKLSVQHLQRAWKEQSPNLEQIMQRLSHTLIEQIDTLSNIATEFSNFAKMPRANNEPVNVSAVLRNTVSLYTENYSATITFYEHKNGDFTVYADRNQLVRVFHNLLKNAVQAVEEKEDGHVHVEIKIIDDRVVVTVKDNGPGIPGDQRARIFTPNFTTKTGGMGLGLAMVKNMVELAGGEVWFTTVTGEGTTFTVSLPLFKADDET